MEQNIEQKLEEVILNEEPWFIQIETGNFLLQKSCFAVEKKDILVYENHEKLAWLYPNSGPKSQYGEIRCTAFSTLNKIKAKIAPYLFSK